MIDLLMAQNTAVGVPSENNDEESKNTGTQSSL